MHVLDFRTTNLQTSQPEMALYSGHCQTVRLERSESVVLEIHNLHPIMLLWLRSGSSQNEPLLSYVFPYKFAKV